MLEKSLSLKEKYCEYASFLIITSILLLFLVKGLLGALIAGFVIYICTHSLANRLPNKLDGKLAKKVSLFLIMGVFITLISWGCIWIAGSLSGHGTGLGLNGLVVKTVQILTELKKILPLWASEWIPESARSVNIFLTDALKSNMDKLQSAGQGVAKNLSRIIIGMIIGGMAAIMVEGKESKTLNPLTLYLRERLSAFYTVFGQVVIAQFKISLINTAFTAIFIGVILPLTGNSIPFAKTLILLTFIVGLIPVLGNLISNTFITIMALSVSVWVAISALVFLIVIHKVEYFLNAKIIGGQINAKAWELLLAMLIMEACFGLAGVIAAPIYYAYLKYELRKKELI